MISTFVGLVFGCIDAVTAERAGRVGAASEVGTNFRNCIVTRCTAQVRA